MIQRQPVLLFLTLITLLAFSACRNHSDKRDEMLLVQRDTANYTTIQWIDTVKNFGTIKQGTQVKLSYRFKNSGEKPLYITNVEPSCGCTVADYTKGAILPGKEGQITAQFDSNHGQPGLIRKSMIVSSNTTNDPNYVVAFIGQVEPK